MHLIARSQSFIFHRVVIERQRGEARVPLKCRLALTHAQMRTLFLVPAALFVAFAVAQWSDADRVAWLALSALGEAPGA